MRWGRRRLRRVGPAVLALGLLIVQLCLPGLQVSMLRLAPAPAAQPGHEEHGHHDAPGKGEAGNAAIACAICAAALLPAAPADFIEAPGPVLAGRAPATLAAAETLRGQARAAPFARGPPVLS